MEALTAFLKAGGWLMLPLLACAFLIWYLYLLYRAELKALLTTPEIEELAIAEKLKAGEELGSISQYLEERQGIIPLITADCFAKMRSGLPFREAMSQSRHFYTAKYSYSFYLLGSLVTAAPLLGLLGTVLGMIQTFSVVGAESGVAAAMLAAGISKALITTQVGLLAALPGTFGLVHLYRLYRHMETLIQHCESHLALLCEHNPQPAINQDNRI